MTQLEFAELGWIHGVWVVLALTAIVVFLELRGRSVLDQMVSRRMQQRLVTRASLPRRLFSILLLSLSLLALVLALMRPQWGMRLQRMTRVDSQVMICLDVSRSMLAEDVAPNRLDRAKAELDTLLSLMEEGQQVGLIAFAGKASVLCPMTTDFGFLRLVLQDALPSSVGLGGTKIGEALRKAVEGFGEAGDRNRVILMITDGEDHDSFPLDAARQARERGIRVLSIGFGDEAGSKIEVTDPATGTRSFVQDRHGQDVVSRLDGEMLRKLALETEGVYIPAGTGALNLESIYEKHIDSLLRGSATDQQQVIRHEAYQWCVLLALILLPLGLLAARPWSLKLQAMMRAADIAGETAPPVVAMLFSMVIVSLAAVSGASAADVIGDTPASSTAESNTAPPPAAADEPSQAEEVLSPRDAYNQALAFLGSDANRAERLLQQARKEAQADGEVRYRSLYNLGWVEVNRADAVLRDKPEEALQHLEAAVDRFREAIRLRPASEDARHNLEILSRRLLKLSDSLQQQNAGDFAARLDDIIQRQRSSQAELASLVQRTAQPADTVELQRSNFRQAAITQRQTISDLQKLSDDARRELDTLTQKDEESLEDEERLRSLQLSGVLRFVEGALQRMQKARALTRRLQGNRAFLRWSAALRDTKRARDQLRNPIELLGAIAADATQLAQLTRGRLLAETPQEDSSEPPPPAWLTDDYLHDSQQGIGERTSEVVAAMSVATTNVREAPPHHDQADPSTNGEAAKMMEKIRQALPLLEEATSAFAAAATALGESRYATASDQQGQGIARLREAMELFFDVRRLIEQMYAEQQQIRDALRITQEPPPADDLVTGALTGAEKNVLRSSRLEQMFDDQLTQLATAEDASSDAAASDRERQRFTLAKQLLTQAQSDFDLQVEQLKSLAGVDSSAGVADSRSAGGAAADRALETMEELRRLFFSLVEHLRDTGRRQAQLRDETALLAGQPDRQSPASLGPLGTRQDDLQQLAEGIGSALRQQAQSSPDAAATPAPTDPADPAALQRFRQASELVDQAAYEMKMSAGSMRELSEAEERDFSETLARQTAALEKVAEALQLLDDSPPQPQDQQQQQQNQQQQNQQQQNQQQQDQQQQQQQQEMDANQLLQLIRDREAQRRRARQRPATNAGGVDKDW